MRRVAALAGAWLLAGLLAAGPAAAQGDVGQGDVGQGDVGWTIERFHVHAHVHEDGSVTVQETIEVDFAHLDKHGLLRVIPVYHDLPGERTRMRAIQIDGVSVESSAPADLQLTRPHRFGERVLRMRIGDPDRTVRGRQHYRITYRVRGALNAHPEHAELYWNATGNQWPVPITEASAVVTGPTPTLATCFRGAPGAASLCDGAGSLHERSAEFAARDLRPGEGLTVVVGFAPGSVTVPEPLFVERWTLATAFAGSPGAWPLAALVGLLAFGGLARLVWRQGRDREALGGQTAAGLVSGDGARRRLGAPRIAPVQFRPPGDLRPGQLGVLVDERVDPVDVSATIVDLAVRGHLVIEEVEQARLFGSRLDWKLRRTGAPEDDLLGFERTLIDALFSGGDEVVLSELKGEFADDYRAVQRGLYADAVERGWFLHDPHGTRVRWLAIGVLATVLATGVFALALAFTTVAAAALPLPLAGIALMLAHRWMPARTPKGSRRLTETLGFREFIRSAETERMAFAEAQNLFVSYLPYAVVFGAVDKWARAFAHLGEAATAAVGGWYVGTQLPGGGGPDLGRLSSGLSELSSTVASTLPTAPASSGSSGFGGGGSSGGGFGGGGGGSW